jgi:hypothetical protein
MGDRITFERSTNARPVDRIARVYPHRPTGAKYVARFGSRMANTLLLMELGAHRKLNSGWDSEWYQGEFLSRLLARLFADPDVSTGAHNPLKWDAHLYQYETIDLEALLFISRGGIAASCCRCFGASTTRKGSAGRSRMLFAVRFAFQSSDRR